MFIVFFFDYRPLFCPNCHASLRRMLSSLTKWCALATGALFLVLIISCRDDNPEKDGADKILKTSQGGDFRGIRIGDKPEDVQKLEDAESVYSMPDELVYRIPPDSKDSTWYEISYNFDDNGLYDIELDIYPKNDSGVEAMKRDFIQYYISKYGECKHTNGYCEWRSMTDTGRIVSITLADTVLKETRPCLEVNFNEKPEY